MSFRDDHQRWHRAFLPALNLPDRFSDAQPTELPAGPVRDAVEQYIDGFWDATDRAIAPCFAGRVGKWKTYGAAVIARYADWHQVPTAFFTCGSYFMRAEAAFYLPEGLSLLKVAQEVPFAVFDDFTQVKPDSRAAELMANVVGERFARRLPTLFTGNIPLETADDLRSLATMYRPDFARRVWQGSEGFRVSIR